MRNKSMLFLILAALTVNVACQRTEETSAKVAQGKRPPSAKKEGTRTGNGTGPGEKTAVGAEDIFQTYTSDYSKEDQELRLRTSELEPGTYKALKVGIRINNLVKAKSSKNKISDANNTIKLIAQTKTDKDNQSAKELAIHSSTGPLAIAELKVLIPDTIVVTAKDSQKDKQIEKVKYVFNQLTVSRKAAGKDANLDNTSKDVVATLDIKTELEKTLSINSETNDLDSPFDILALGKIQELGNTGNLLITKTLNAPQDTFNYISKLETETAEIFIITEMTKKTATEQPKKIEPETKK